MIFTRRALQRRLDELRPLLGEVAVDGLASRLNRSDEHRLGAMWEVVILHALSKHGSLGHEVALPSGRRPDVDFGGPGLSFIADITATSDEGLHEKNPFDELSMLIEQLKDRLGLPIGGVDLCVRSREERTSRGSRTVLRLPDRGQLRDFVKAEIEPKLRAQLRAGDTVLRVDMDDDKAVSSSRLTQPGHPTARGPTDHTMSQRSRIKTPSTMRWSERPRSCEGRRGSRASSSATRILPRSRTGVSGGPQ